MRTARTRPARRLTVSLATALFAASAALTALTGAGPRASAAGGVPQPDHVVIVVFENKKANAILGNNQAPYINALAAGGAKFTQSYAIEHPSEPNYLDLFSGANQGVTDDSCPHTFATANQAAQLIAAGRTFVGYSEGLPSAGSTVCVSGRYARKHNPWVNFSNVPASANQPFTAFPTNFTQLPTVAWVVPDLCNDMHDCTIATGDAWLENRLGAYAQWATTHNSLLIVTFDEDDGGGGNNIATVFYGQPVRPGTYTEHIDHFDVLRTVADMYELPYAGAAADATTITDCWATSAGSVSVANPGSRSSVLKTPVAPLQLTAAGGAPPYTWSATGLPPGLTIGSTGVVSGTPTKQGKFTVTVRATDTAGATGNATFSWTVKRR
jgi:hypothetical protein